MRERRYLIVIEGAQGENFSAYAPDLPGCVATGAIRDDVECEMRDAIAFHLEGLRKSGEPIPEPSELTATSSTSPHRRHAPASTPDNHAPPHERRSARHLPAPPASAG
jgi:predicted RNase H-like HicB family nuclease